MAKAKLIEQVEDKPFCTLELTRLEAEMVKAVFGVVRGRGAKRSACNSVWEALGKIGVEKVGSEVFDGFLEIRG